MYVYAIQYTGLLGTVVGKSTNKSKNRLNQKQTLLIQVNNKIIIICYRSVMLIFSTKIWRNNQLQFGRT